MTVQLKHRWMLVTWAAVSLAMACGDDTSVTGGNGAGANGSGGDADGGNGGDGGGSDGGGPTGGSPGVPTDCSAVPCYHVREGAPGPDGADWDTALPSLPEELERGAVYFVADGSYASYVFDDEESGTESITIKKATDFDHGAEAGWTDDYGDGQASFDGSLSFARDHYLIDGATRDEGDWMNAGAYGIHASGVYIQSQNFPPGGDHITVRYCDLGAPYSQSFTEGQGEAVYLGGFDAVIEDITVSRCFLHNWSFIQCAGADGVTVEHTAFAAGWAKEAFRGQGVCRNGVIRHNLFYNSSQMDPGDPTSGTTAEIAIWDGEAGAFDNWEIYGNVIWNDKAIFHSGGTIVVGGDGVGWVGAPANNVKVYNNTIAGLEGAALASILINGGTGNEVSNNLWYDCGGAVNATPNTSDNGQVATDPFVDYAAFDFRLESAQPGTSLPAPYDVDLDGVTRGADGVFDRGAFEHVAR